MKILMKKMDSISSIYNLLSLCAYEARRYLDSHADTDTDTDIDTDTDTDTTTSGKDCIVEYARQIAPFTFRSFCLSSE